ncbi:MAG: hypothetical protein K0R83_2747 [Caulobacter sp.]|jgi:hypothetical protein|nr:hypothetical protein [Caulobacter sp.]
MLDWLEPWSAIVGASASERAGLARELTTEVGPNHVLFGQTPEAIARRIDTDDVLFRLSDGRVAEVHLTWSQSQESDTFFPATTLYASLEEWAGLGMAADHEDRKSNS